MISICIPVYNFNVKPLVDGLVKLIVEFDQPVEIIIADDGSDENIRKENRGIAGLDVVSYHELEENVGRAAIRNKMAGLAKFDYLLFIDADSEIPSTSYLKNYIGQISENRVLCGGTQYSAFEPFEKEKLLRWKYGQARESVNAATRNADKGFVITSNNFLIRKDVFLGIGFDEDISKYGHEDTLLGYNLFKKGYEIFHINNPVVHTGLETGEQFLHKTRQGIENLKLISNKLGNPNDFVDRIPLLKVYFKIKKWGFKVLVSVFFRLLRKRIEKNLLGLNPSLLLFDFYKLGYLCGLKKL